MGNMRLLAAFLLAGRSSADVHRLFTSSFSTPHLYGLEFDDQANTLINIANITAQSGHPWLSFSYDKTSLYAAERNSFASYNVLNGGTDLAYNRSVSVSGTCSGAQSKDSTQSFVIAELRTPFTVYAAPYGSCGAAIGVDIEGNLDKVIQNVPFRANSAVQGMALDPENKFLYSADEKANGIWTHSVDDKGKLTHVSFTNSPRPDSGPRHLIVHPNGRYLYVVLSNTNAIVVYAITSGPTAAKEPLKNTGVMYSLLPQGQDAKRYAADEVFLSADSNVLYSSTRFRNDVPPPPEPWSPPPKSTGGGDDSGDDDDDDVRRPRVRAAAASQPGYITAILLTQLYEEESPITGRATGAGFPVKTLFQIKTSTGGGLANSVSPAPWGNDYFALVDSEVGAVEVWKVENLSTANYSGAVAQGAAAPPAGGWVSGVWQPSGSVIAPDVADPASPKGGKSGKGKQNGQPEQPAQPAQPAQPKPAQPQPANPWQQGGWGVAQQVGNNDPWQWGSQGQAGKSNGGNQPWSWNSNPTNTLGGKGNGNQGSSIPGWTWGNSNDRRRPSANQMESSNEVEEEEEDNEEKRKKYALGPEQPKARHRSAFEKLGRINSRQRSHDKRQLQAAAQPSPPVTAKVVARWKSPVGGGIPGRRQLSNVDDMQVEASRKHVVNLKPWTGSRKRSDAAAPVVEVSQEPAADDPYQAEVKAAKEGRSCCANAVWFD